MKNPWPYILAFALIFYSNGAAFIEGFVNYPSWRLIGANEFLGYHHFIAPRVIGLLVAPALTATLLTIAMLRWRPPAIPVWSVWVAIGLQLVVWTSTAAIQIPMQVQFSGSGFSEETLTNLIVSNFWLRRIPMGLTAALFVWMMHKTISNPPTDERSSAPPQKVTP